MFAEQRAFTLIELLIVVAIIAILAAIAVPNFLEAQVRAKVSRAHNDMRSMATALESYRIDHTGYVPYYDQQPWWQPYMHWMKMLTTPVAYMTSIPKDSFQVAGYATGNDLGYMYHERVSFDVQFGEGEFARRDLPEDRYATAMWYLRSPGTDKLWWWQTGLPLGYALPWHAWDEYDSSNGTVSDGDIIRYGP